MFQKSFFYNVVGNSAIGRPVWWVFVRFSGCRVSIYRVRRSYGFCSRSSTNTIETNAHLERVHKLERIHDDTANTQDTSHVHFQKRRFSFFRRHHKLFSKHHCKHRPTVITLQVGLHCVTTHRFQSCVKVNNMQACVVHTTALIDTLRNRESTLDQTLTLLQHSCEVMLMFFAVWVREISYKVNIHHRWHGMWVLKWK